MSNRRDSTPQRKAFKWTQYRSPHRQRSHQQAHLNAAADQLQPVFEHPQIAPGDPLVISDPPALDDLIAALRAAGSFAYDSEFIGENSYYPKLCVIQVATTEQVALIDPLAEDIDLTPFWELLADPAVEKVVHAGQQDLEPVFRHTGQPPRNIFDTQIAAAFAGQYFPIAMGKLAQALIGVDLGAGLKFSQWDHRPLSRVQLRYAADDVRYLPLVRLLLREQLEANSNAAWVQQEMVSLENPSLYQFDAQSQRVRVRGVERLSRRQTAVLHALVAWRNETARQHNVPPRSLLRDGVLHDMARTRINTVADLDGIRGLPRPVEDTYGDTLVKLIHAARSAPLPPMKREPRFDRDAYREQVERIWAEVESRAAARSIHPGIVTSKKELARLVHHHATGQPIDRFRIMHGWRRELLDSALQFTAAPTLRAQSQNKNKKLPTNPNKHG